MKLPRRQFLHLAAGAAALPAVSRVAWAQTYPSRPVTLIVFVPAGGTPDIIARLVGQALSQRLGQSVVIDNRPGGGGNLALQAVARAPADGYTLLMVATPHAVNVTLYEKSTVTVTRDIVPVASINNDSFVLLVESVVRGQDGPRVHRLCQGQSWQDQPGFERDRKLEPSQRRTVSDDDRHRSGPRTLSRHAGGAFGTPGRRRARDVRRHWLVDAANPVGRVARARSDGARRACGCCRTSRRSAMLSRASR